MKQLIIFCVTLFLTLSNLNVQSSAIDIVEKLEKLNEDQYETEFTDLNADCMLIILEDLSFTDLLSMAQINVEFSAFAANVYRRKYSHEVVKITDYDRFSDELYELLIQTETVDADTFDRIYRDHPHLFNKRPKVKTHDGIGIDDYETMWNTFNHFGHEIKKLETSTHSWEPREFILIRALIGYLISEYSSESLVEIRLCNIPDRLLEHITKPMTNVENVKFSYFTNEPKPELFQKVETLFPRVNRFEISGFELKNASIQLDSVTTFVADRGYSVSVANFHFPRLQTLHLDYVHERFTEHHTFLNEHNHLRHLRFQRNLPTDSQFERLTANLKDLVELTLKHDDPDATPALSTNALVEFLRSHEKVKQLNVINFQERWRNELQERLQNGWNMRTIEVDGKAGLSFERQ